MIMKRVFKISSFIRVLLISLIGMTELSAQGGLYFGGNIGSSYINKSITDIDVQDIKIDGKDMAYKIYAGYKLPSFLAIEGGYRDLGSVSQDLLDLNNSGWDLNAKGDISLGPLHVFAKAGAFFNNVKVTFQDPIHPDINKNNTKFMFGFGAGLTIKNIGIRAEWESLDLSKENKVSMLTAGITYSLTGRD